MEHLNSIVESFGIEAGPLFWTVYVIIWIIGLIPFFLIMRVIARKFLKNNKELDIQVKTVVPMKVTNQEITVCNFAYSRFNRFVIPMHSPVSFLEGSGGGYYVKPEHLVFESDAAREVAHWDLVHHYVWVKDEYVTEIEVELYQPTNNQTS